MSARFSRSPALCLRIGSSRIRTGLLGLLALCCGVALALVYARGYPVLAVALLPPTLALLWYLRRERWRGAQISWRGGVWRLEEGASQRLIVLSPRSAGIPGLVYLAWRDVGGGSAGGVWLFADSAPGEQLRRLRVRLSLER